MTNETQDPGHAAPVDERAAKRRKLIIIAAAIAAVLLIAWLFLRGEDTPEEDPNSRMPLVTVTSPGSRMVDRTINVTGTLAARREMPVAVVGEGGMVTRVLVEPGAWVRAGQVLAVIERSVQVEQVKSLAAQLEVARAEAKLAQANLDRAQALLSRGFISRADIDQRTATRDSARARVNVASAQLNEARARTGRLDIRAPEAGMVLTRDVEAGQVVSGGSGVLFRMAKDGEMEMLAQVTEADLGQLSVGVPATVTPVGTTNRFEGRIWQLSPVVDLQTRQGIARILLRYDPAIRPGGFASATIVAGSAATPLLPESAIQSDDKGSYVYIINAQDQVERRNVKLGQVSDRGVAIAGGLNGRERVVTLAGAFLVPGQKVRPQLDNSRR